jgi:uncharacterized membrane protein
MLLPKEVATAVHWALLDRKASKQIKVSKIIFFIAIDFYQST